MPFIPAPNCTKSTITFILRAQRCQIVLNFEWGAPASGANRAALNTALHTWYTNQLGPFVSSHLDLAQIDTVNLDTATSPGSTLVISPGEHGTGGAIAPPLNTASVITHRTGFRGRSFRGRSYVPGLDVSSGYVEHEAPGSVLAGVISAFGWLMTAANTASAVWSVLSKYTGGAPRILAQTTPITAVSADSFWDSQRRRLVGRGN